MTKPIPLAVLACMAFSPAPPVLAAGEQSWEQRMAEGSRYRIARRYAEAERSFRLAVEASAGPNFNYVASLSSLAAVLKLRGKHQDAERLYREALALSKEYPGRRNLNYAVCLHNLASFYCEMTRYKEAESLSVQALEAMEKAVGREDPIVAGALDTLGEIQFSLGRHNEAEAAYLRALAIQRKALGRDVFRWPGR